MANSKSQKINKVKASLSASANHSLDKVNKERERERLITHLFHFRFEIKKERDWERVREKKREKYLCDGDVERVRLELDWSPMRWRATMSDERLRLELDWSPMRWGATMSDERLRLELDWSSMRWGATMWWRATMRWGPISGVWTAACDWTDLTFKGRRCCSVFTF